MLTKSTWFHEWLDSKPYHMDSSPDQIAEYFSIFTAGWELALEDLEDRLQHYQADLVREQNLHDFSLSQIIQLITKIRLAIE